MILPILSVHLDALEAGLMPAGDDNSVFVGEIAYVAQSLLIEFLLLKVLSASHA